MSPLWNGARGGVAGHGRDGGNGLREHSDSEPPTGSLAFTEIGGNLTFTAGASGPIRFTPGPQVSAFRPDIAIS